MMLRNYQKRIIAMFLLVSMIIIQSCTEQVCSNKNPVFEQHDSKSPEYKKEVAKLLENFGTEAFRFWISDVNTESETAFLELSLQGRQSCATVDAICSEETGNLLKGGYRGAELKHVKLSQQVMDGDLFFVLEHVGNVID